ncbi:hypothetical protein GGR54DRAFT_601038 [Hypoxylon sp. NC1633]|nr:hypothetical protein GGR54DRAFT_601038 [Hypoxylon sp. NC1633]
MAEVLGIAASGIAIAQISSQVGGAVIKLKQLWDQVKEVPDDIADLMEQIDCLNPVLWETENSFEHSSLPPMVWGGLASKSTAMYCRKALRDLTEIVDELNLQINHSKKARRKIAAVKVLLKRDSIKKLERRLENAIRMLTLAQQSYLVALTRVQPDIIVQKFAALTTRETRTKFQIASGSTSNTGEQSKENAPRSQPNKAENAMQPRQRHYAGFTGLSVLGRVLIDSRPSSHKIVFQVPKWLSRRSWELHSVKAYGAWQWYMRSYSVMPQDSRAMRIAKEGSPIEMRQLFDEGLASPYDRSRNGDTLLHNAAYGGNFEMIQYLMSVGISPQEPSLYRFYNCYPAQLLSLNMTRGSSFYKKALSDPIFAKEFLIFSELNIPEDDEDEDEDSDLQSLRPLCMCHVCFHDLELYEFLLPYQCPRHRHTSIQSRISVQAGIIPRIIPLFAQSTVNVIKTLLQPEWSINPQTVCTSCPMICLAASRLSWIITGSKQLRGRYFRLPRPTDYDIESWFHFAVEIIKYTPNVHAVSDLGDAGRRPITAFYWILDFHFWDFFEHSKLRYLAEALIVVSIRWLEALEEAGVDLVAYGCREHELLLDPHGHQGLGRLCGPSMDFQIYLIGFKYGSKPTDWEIYWEEPTDRFAGEFWALIENPPLRIPGSWVDDDGFFEPQL